MSIAMRVQERIKRLKKGQPFTVESFYEIGSVSAVQKALSRLVQSGEIRRVSKGLYARPRPVAAIPGVKVGPSADQVVAAWARTHGYKIAEQGMAEAYRLGFQTQAPVRKIFWTTGPSREFHIGNTEIKVRHVSEKKLKWESTPAGAFLRGLLAVSDEVLTEQLIENALKRIELSHRELFNVISTVKGYSLISERKRSLLQRFETEFLSSEHFSVLRQSGSKRATKQYS